jgi:hypothetical protein
MELTYKFDTSQAAVNLFTTEHLNSMNSLINKDAHPEKYGDSFKTIKFVGFEIIDANEISLDTKQLSTTSVSFQQTRKGGGISDAEDKDLDTSLVNNGVMLNVPPGAVYRRSKECRESDKPCIYITGQSREEKYRKYNFRNRLVAVYEQKKEVVDGDIQNELSQLRNIFNPRGLPQVPAKEYDIIDEVLRAIDAKWIKPDYDSILERVLIQCKPVSIGKTRATQIAMTVLNNISSSPVLPMTADKATEWLEGSKYKNIEGKVRYVVKSYDIVSKGQVDAVKSAKKYPNEEVRVIVHCGIVTSGMDQYTARLTKFWVDWYAQLDAYKDTYFNGQPIKPRNLTLYGGVPQVTEEFDTTQVCLFVQDSVTGEFTQKIDGKIEYWS